MKELLTLIFVISLGPQFSGATDYLSPFMHLRKIKIRLLGSDPTNKEYEDLREKLESCENKVVSSPDNQCVNQTLEQYIREYLDSDAFIGKSVDFLHELLYLKPNDRPYELVYDGWALKQGNRNNSLDNLFIDIFKNNKSWDEFFTSGSLNAYNGEELFIGYSEATYFSGHIPDDLKPLKRDENFSVYISNPDLAAGFMITPRFNSRYFNTPINEGRKRAAAILRIGFCDPMFPAIERGEEHLEVEDQIAKGLSFEEITSGLENAAALHGKRRDCMQCHVFRGLDHLAWTFRATEQILDKNPTPGRFTYLKENGELVDEPVKGIGDFARKFISQEEYRQCQVRNFWREYVGSDRVLDENPEMAIRLTEKFDSLGRRVQDFISHLVMHDEFRSVKSTRISVDPTFEKARSVLSNCVACHRGVQPDFTSLPIGWGDEDQTEFYAERIIERLAIHPYSNSSHRTMPPTSSSWQPSEVDIQSIKNWILSGAPDQEGKKHLSPEWLRKLKEGSR